MTTEHSGTLDIAVIGAGIVGVSCAEWLRRDGHRVTLIDRQPPGRGTSYGNAGILARCAVVPVPVPGLLKKVPPMLLRGRGPMYLRWRYLPKLMPWLIPFLRNARPQRVEQIAGALAHLLGDTVEQHLALARGTPAERLICTDDYFYVYRRRADYEAETFAWQLRARHGMTGEPVEARELAALDPHLSDDYRFAYRLTQHGHVKDPSRYVQALCDWFVAQGGQWRQAEVLDITPTEDGARVQLQGEPLAVQRVVLAAGPWSARLAGATGHRPPLEAERGYHLEFTEPSHEPPVPYMVADAKFVLTPMAGRLRAAGLVEFGGLEAAPSPRPLRHLQAAVQALYPTLRYRELRTWQGARPSTPDSLPMLGRARGNPAVYFAFGHQHVGLTAGPKSGRIVADLIAGRAGNADLSPFAADRFD